MEVYIEYVILDNLVVDYLLLFLTLKTLRLKTNRLLVFLSATLGTVASCVMPLLNLNNGFTYTVKILLAAIMTLLCCRFNRIKEYVRTFYLFVFYTFLFGGAVIAVCYFLGIEYYALDFTYSPEFSLGLVLLPCIVVYVVLRRLVTVIYKKKEIEPFVRKCSVFIGGREIRFSGFIDSGNRLFCPQTGFPVVLCSPKAGKRLYDGGFLIGARSEVMRFYTAAGSSTIKIYEMDKLEIYNGDKQNTLYNVMIGISRRDFKDVDYDLILNPALV